MVWVGCCQLHLPRRCGGARAAAGRLPVCRHPHAPLPLGVGYAPTCVLRHPLVGRQLLNHGFWFERPVGDAGGGLSLGALRRARREKLGQECYRCNWGSATNQPGRSDAAPEAECQPRSAPSDCRGCGTSSATSTSRPKAWQFLMGCPFQAMNHPATCCPTATPGGGPSLSLWAAFLRCSRGWSSSSFIIIQHAYDTRRYCG